MDINSLIFPAPKSSYSAEEYKGGIIWIPRKKEFSYKEKLRFSNYRSFVPGYNVNSNSTNSGNVQSIPRVNFILDNKFNEEVKPKYSIPCLFLSQKKSRKLILYFHANYEDLGQASDLLDVISKSLQINILAVEYPNYGIYSFDQKCSSELILEDSEIVYSFLKDIMGYKEDHIILMGRCIGSGPAFHLASQNNPKALIVISAFTSIKAAIKNIVNSKIIGWVVEKIIYER